MRSVTRLFTILVLLGSMVAPVLAAQESAPAGGTFRFERGRHIVLSNPNGSIRVIGGDGDSASIEARDTDSGEYSSVVLGGLQGSGVVEARPASGGDDVELIARLPRYALLDSVEASNGDVTVEGVEGVVRVVAHNGTVRVSRVGGVVARSQSGDVAVSEVRGTVYVESDSGDVTVGRTEADVTVKAKSGDVTISDAGGRVDATVASGDVVIATVAGIVNVYALSGDVAVRGASAAVQVQCVSGSASLEGVDGDCDVSSTSGDVSFTGEIRAEHSYHLKSMSGSATVRICGSIPGFTVTLNSYSGDIETQFPLVVDRPTALSRSVTGRYGDGKTQIRIEAFSGSAELLKCDAKTDAER